MASYHAQYFTTDDTWTTPSYAVFDVTMTCWAGGGMGGSRTTRGSGGGGGGGGCSVSKFSTLDPGLVYNVMVGIGGNSRGVDGTVSRIDDLNKNTLCFARFGYGVNPNSTSGASGGSTSGAVGNYATHYGGNGANGGNMFGGGGGGGAGSANDGGNASTSIHGTGGSASGGNGGQGLVILAFN